MRLISGVSAVFGAGGLRPGLDSSADPSINTFLPTWHIRVLFGLLELSIWQLRLDPPNPKMRERHHLITLHIAEPLLP